MKKKVQDVKKQDEYKLSLAELSSAYKKLIRTLSFLQQIAFHLDVAISAETDALFLGSGSNSVRTSWRKSHEEGVFLLLLVSAKGAGKETDDHEDD